MSTQTALAGAREQRQFVRLPFSGPVQYRYGAAETGTATTCNIGRGGMCLLLGRYLRPGTLLMVARPGTSDELKARITWSSPTATNDLFVAGIRILHDEQDSLAAMSDMLYDALASTGNVDCLAEERVTPGYFRTAEPIAAKPRAIAPKWIARLARATAALFSLIAALAPIA